MNRILEFLLRGCTFLVALTLVACGGEGNNARDLDYTLLDGAPGQFTVAERGLTTFIGPCSATLDPNPSERGARLLAVVNDIEGLAPYRDCAERLLSQAEFSRVLAFTQQDYLTSHTLVGAYLWNQGLEFHRVFRVTEYDDKVEVGFEVCNQNSTNMDATPNSSTAWIAVPKTKKPVVVLPLQFPNTTPYYMQSIGKCV